MADNETIEIKVPTNTYHQPAVWLIWGITKHDRCDLISVVTNNGARERDIKYALSRGYIRAFDELATLDHLYGEGILKILNDKNIR